MCPQQRRGISAHDVPDTLDVGGIILQGFVVPEPQAELTELGPDIEPESRGNRDHLAQVFACFGSDSFGPLVTVTRDICQAGLEFAVIANALVDVTRDFVATPNQLAFSHIQHDRRLSGDENREIFEIFLRSQAGFCVKAVCQS